MKKPTLEQQARALDDSSKPIREMAREIAQNIGGSPDIIKNYLRALRNGHESYYRMRLQERGCEKAGQLARSYPHTTGMTLSQYQEGLRLQNFFEQLFDHSEDIDAA